MTLVGLLCSFFMVQASVSTSAGSVSCSESQFRETCRDPEFRQSGESAFACLERLRKSCQASFGSGQNKCDVAYGTYQNVESDTTSVCSGYGSGSIYTCAEKVERCTADTAAEDASANVGTILTAFGMPSVQAFATNNECPQFTSDKMEDQLAQVQDTLEKSTEKVVELQEQINKESAKVNNAEAQFQERMANSDNSIVQEELDSMARKRGISESAFQEKMSLKQQLDRAHDSVLQAQKMVAQAIRAKNQALLDLKRRCDNVYDNEKAAILKEIDDQAASGRTLAGGINGFSHMEASYEARLREVYGACLERAREDRVEIIAGASEEVRSARQMERRAQSNMDLIAEEIAVQKSRSEGRIEEETIRLAAFKENQRRQIESEFAKLDALKRSAQDAQETNRMVLDQAMKDQMAANVQLQSIKARMPATQITETPEAARGAVIRLSNAAKDFTSLCCSNSDMTKNDQRCSRLKQVATTAEGVSGAGAL